MRKEINYEGSVFHQTRYDICVSGFSVVQFDGIAVPCLPVCTHCGGILQRERYVQFENYQLSRFSVLRRRGCD